MLVETTDLKINTELTSTLQLTTTVDASRQVNATLRRFAKPEADAIGVPGSPTPGTEERLRR